MFNSVRYVHILLSKYVRSISFSLWYCFCQENEETEDDLIFLLTAQVFFYCYAVNTAKIFFYSVD